jgi:adenylate cyclase
MHTLAVLARIRHRFRVEVSTLFVAILLLQAVLLLALGYAGAERLLLSVGHAAHAAEHTRVQTELRAFFQSATGAVRALAAAPGQSLSATGERRAADLIWAFMTESTALDGLYFAHADGSMVGLQRHPHPLLRRIHVGSRGLREVLEHKPGLENPELAPAARYATTRTEEKATEYDVRTRAWFHRAVSSMQPHWTAVHSLPFAQELGVVYSAPDALPDAHGTLDGVAAGEISLRHLETLVESFSHAGAGEGAVLTADDHVLARSDDEGFIRELRVPAAGDVLHPLLAAVASHPADARPVDVGGSVYLVRASPIPGTPWKFVSWLPQDAVVGGLRRGLALAAGVLAACLGTGLLLSLWLSRRISKPIELLAQVARRIGRLDLDGLPRVHSRVEEIYRLDASLDESARSLHALRKFVPTEIVHRLVRRGQSLEPMGRMLDLTVMFTDVEGFTSIAAAVPPERLVPQLTEYFSLVSEIVVRHGGTIDKYMGDGMMVLWGAPEPLDDAAWHAAQAAWEIQQQLQVRNAAWLAAGLPQLHTRIGLHTGPAIAGVLGSDQRLGYTAFGDTVNLASRIEGMNKELGTRTLASEATARALGGRMRLRSCGAVELRGRAGQWLLYEIQGPA